MHSNQISATLIASLLTLGVASADEAPSRSRQPAATKASVDAVLAGWTARPVLAAQQMMAKYGPPTEATSEKLVWRNAAPYKRIVVTREETPHDFPLPHFDYLEHTIAYRVPVDKTNAITAFDGSATFDRTVGELSARCDLEGHNILTLNLANDVATGKKSAEEARAAFGQAVTEDVLGKHPAYATSLQFGLKGTGAPDADVPVIAGSPRRGAEAGRDATTLGTMVAIDMNEVLAAMVATEKKPSPAVLAYAKMLHEAHGRHLTETLKLGTTLKVAPGATPATDRISVKGAKELSALVPLTGERFESAFLAAMIKGHTEALQVIDGLRAQAGQPDALKQHLDMTRSHVATHLAEAKKLQADLRRPQAKMP